MHNNGNSEKLLDDIKTEDPDSGILDEFEDNDMVSITFLVESLVHAICSVIRFWFERWVESRHA